MALAARDGVSGPRLDATSQCRGRPLSPRQLAEWSGGRQPRRRAYYVAETPQLRLRPVAPAVAAIFGNRSVSAWTANRPDLPRRLPEIPKTGGVPPGGRGRTTLRHPIPRRFI